MELSRQSNGQPLILSEDNYNGITRLIQELAVNTGARSVVFCESNGYAVTHVGDVKGLDLPAISSLAANNFSATAKMAEMLGETASFKYLYHEGEKTNLYISNVGFDFVLLVIFEVDVALGMIRIYTRKTISALTDLLQSTREADARTQEMLDSEFKSLLSEELDKSLNF